MVPAPRPRSPLAPDARSLRGSGFGIHAPADSGRDRHSILPTLARSAFRISPPWRKRSESDVLHAWQGLGYYARARNLHAAAKFVRANWGGELPTSTAPIAQLPGVGRYTAGAIATFAFDLPEPIVEANIGRVLARLTNCQTPIDSTAGTAHLWQAATTLLPRKGARAHNSALMDLGALVCVPRQPRCGECPVRSYCRAEQPELLAGETKTAAHRRAFRAARLCPAPESHFARAIERSLARNVDPASSRTEPGTRSTPEDRFPIHSPSRHARRFCLHAIGAA